MLTSLARLCAVLTIMVGLVCATSYMEDERSLRVLYDSRVNLTCADDHVASHNAEDMTFQWLLPSGELVDTSSPPDVSSHSTLHDNGSSLVISAVDRPHFGVYMCLVHLHGTPTVHHIVRWAVNVDGPYFGDLSAKFWAQSKIGLVAGIAVCVFMTMLCINLEQFDSHNSTKPNLGETKPSADVNLRQYFPAQQMFTSEATPADREMFYTNPAFVDEGLGDHQGCNIKEDGDSNVKAPTGYDEELNHAEAAENEPKTTF